MNIQQSEATVLGSFFFCLSKNLCTKSNALYSDFSIKPRRLKVSFLKAEFFGSEVYGKAIILFSHLVLLLQSEGTCLLYLLSTCQTTKDMCTWFHVATRPKYGYGYQCYDVIRFSTSVGKSHFRNPSRLPESLFNIACLQINFQRRDNSRWQDVN